MRFRPHIQAIDYVNYCALHPLFELVKATASHALLGSVLMSLIPLCLHFPLFESVTLRLLPLRSVRRIVGSRLGPLQLLPIPPADR